MKFVVVLSALLGVALSIPIEPQKVHVVQDTLGNYNINVKLHDNVKTEQRHADGTVTGSYGYVDPHGILRNIQYVAGPDGFHVIGGNLMPIAIAETPEVLEARARHLALFPTAV